MMYITVPEKTRIDDLSQIKSYNEIQTLFSRHGLGISYFGHNVVSFYDAKQCAMYHVPINYFYKVSKKEFLMFVSLVKRLDESEKKIANMVKYINRVV